MISRSMFAIVCLGSDALEYKSHTDAVCCRPRLLIESQFGAVVGGEGTHSYRLFEVMAAGAVPVVIGAETIDGLPFQVRCECHVSVSGVAHGWSHRMDCHRIWWIGQLLQFCRGTQPWKL